MFTVTSAVISPESCDFPWDEAISYLFLNLEHWLYFPMLQWLSAKSLRNAWKHVCIPAYLPLKVSSWLLSSLPLWRPPTIFLLCSTGSSVMILKWQCFPIASPYAQFPTLTDGPTGLTGYLSKVITMLSWKHRPTFYTLKKSHSSSSSLLYNHHITLSCIYPQS